MAKRKGKHQVKRSGADLPRALDLLEQRRAPYRELLAQIVADTLARFPPAPDLPIVEIGAGSGQLRAWLPSELAARIVHTDPSEPALRRLRARTPGATTRVASAEALPFADGGCGAVVGLCVFDALADDKAAVAEAARVLAPGGRFVHFLDMATLLEAPFTKLAASGLIPIPNVLGDPADTEWPLDILLLERGWLGGLLEFAAGIAHPLSTAFGAFFARFFADRFDADQATRAFQAIASSGEQRHALMTTFVSACRLAAAQGRPAQPPLPFHSGKYLKSVLDTVFTGSGAFEIELSEIVARSTIRALGRRRRPLPEPLPRPRAGPRTRSPSAC